MFSAWLLCCSLIHHIFANEEGKWKMSHDPREQRTSAGPVGIQIHSFNDLREFPALFGLKGIRYIKVDPHYLNALECVEQRRVKGLSLGGCFVLNHNPPNRLLGHWRDDYNTTEDLLSFLIDPSNRKWFGKDYTLNMGGTVYIALCWKSIPLDDPCSFIAKESWVPLVDDFFQKANEAVASYDLDVEFVMDSGVPNECHKDRWRPWVSTSSWSLEAFYSNNEEEGYDRYQVLNPSWGSGKATSNTTRILGSGAPCGDFAQCAALKWGKFANASSVHPFQVWEPSDQETIRLAIDTFIDANVTYAPGLRFAINIDPAMFYVYSSGYGKGPGRNDVLRIGASLPQLTVLGSEDLVLFVVRSKESEALYRVASPSSAVSTGPFVKLENGDGNLDFYPTSISASTILNTTTVVLASDSSGRGTIYTLDEQPRRLVPRANVNNPKTRMRLIRGTRLVAALRVDDDDDTSCAMTMTISMLSANLTVEEGSKSRPICVSGAPNTTVVSPGSTIDRDNLSCDILGDTSASATHASVRALLAYAIGGVLYGTTVSLEAEISDDDRTAVSIRHVRVNGLNVTNTTTSPIPIAFFVGSRPSVSLLAAGVNEEVQAALVVGDSFCWNNEVHNKDANVAVCSQIPTSTKGILTYAFGRFDDFVRNMQDPTRAILSACSETLAVGSYDQGSRPVVSLYVKDTGNVGILAAHEGFNGDGDSTVCGTPLPRQGDVVLDEWPLFSYEGNMRTEGHRPAS